MGELRSLIELRREPWLEQAYCRLNDLDTSIFFPGPGGSQREAKEACARCSVRGDCDDYAARTGTEWGIWGGVIRKRKGKAKPANETEDLVRVQRADLRQLPGPMEGQL